MSIPIERYHLARIEIESQFEGLPYVHVALISRLLSRANPNNGIIDNFTYHDLGLLLTVAASPGRKDAGTPTKSTLRSILRTIESACRNDFKVVSEGSQLIIHFTTLSQIYAKHDLIKDEISDQVASINTPEMLEKSSQNDEFKCDQISDQITDLSTEDSMAFSPVKNINKTNLNKQQTNITSERNFSSKKPIDATFYPSQETIELALQGGFAKVTDLAEISKFIAYNQEQGSRWPDFNPIFIKWLEREKAQATNQQKAPLRSCHERRTPKGNTFELLMQAVMDANPNARAPSECRSFEGETHIINGEHSMAMASDDSHLWPAIRQQAWGT